MLQRGLDYLEAVGDVMSDARLDCLLLDPVSCFRQPSSPPAGLHAHEPRPSRP